MDLHPLPRDYWVHQIATMDPEVQWAEIYGITTGHEFPWDSQRATELALVRTYAVPAIAELLARTREFIDNAEKRYDDTAVILVESGNYISGKTDDPTPIRRLNRMHGSYDIPNDQFLYVLATFVVMPRRWIDRYGYRPLTVAEVESMVRYWQRMGELMGIANVPADYDGFADYLDTYEHERFGYSSSGRAISDATFDLVDSWYPAALRPLVRWAGIAMLDTPLRRALGYDDPPAVVATGFEAALQVRKRVIKWLPARRDYVSPLDRLRLRTYPGGYDVAQVGTFPVRKTQSS
jgi:hypothetical protein